MKVAVIGGVASTETLIRKLAEHGFEDVAIWGYRPVDPRYVSGWRDLAAVGEELGFAHKGFRKVTECHDELKDFQPDILFAVGLSQILTAPMLKLAKLVNIGFHPTALPKGRGRAAIAWLVLEEADGAANFFEMQDGVDDGPIFVQEPFAVTAEDDATSVESSLLYAEERALDNWLPQLAKGDLSSTQQDHSQASWYWRRGPEDGCIEWSQPSTEICRLIRASTTPHPGAFTHCNGSYIRIWAAQPLSLPERGVVGAIGKVLQDGSFVVQTGADLLHVTTWDATQDWQPKVGQRLGYNPQVELHRLREICTAPGSRPKPHSKLRIIGAGGHGKVVADTAEAMGYHDIAFLDQAFGTRQTNGRWPIIGSPTSSTGGDTLFCAVGNNSVRAQLFETYSLKTAPLLAHPSAILSESATLGAGTLVAAGVIVNADTHIGQGVILNTGCSIDHDCAIGDFVHISPGARLAGNITIGARSWIGIGAVIREGVTIGKDVMVAAGAAVIDDVPDGLRVGGVPAKPI